MKGNLNIRIIAHVSYFQTIESSLACFKQIRLANQCYDNEYLPGY
ncbi:hypothetical protein A33Q_0142 [Indibacter alkaliphilus LW1]|uniref:Uncharacterized protein n=1 Tax=Indibacter alkaliphilus (strain CCUG 57479 / KCTC 22604 / LW1) TaxID=1189612 RepID=S2DSK8_INDAL|nr:hypothetical protein A33Q_0142 [Indibacter alkaliphilus LW1]